MIPRTTRKQTKNIWLQITEFEIIEANLDLNEEVRQYTNILKTFSVLKLINFGRTFKKISIMTILTLDHLLQKDSDIMAYKLSLWTNSTYISVTDSSRFCFRIYLKLQFTIQ